MTKLTRKIQGFTLSEMMVVLVITVIVVGLAFSVLQLVQKQMGAIGTNYQNTSELNLLRQALWIDFNTYPYLYYDENTQVLRCENGLDFKEYTFTKEWVLREKDTFDLPLKTPLLFVDGKEVSGGSIDALRLSTSKELGNKQLFVHQKNAVDEYMH